MRMSSPKANRTKVKVPRMKASAPKNKKLTEPKARDYISETISFVIKGKLTPIKGAFVAKKDKKMSPPKRKETDAPPEAPKQKRVAKKIPPKVQPKTAKKPTSALIKPTAKKITVRQEPKRATINSKNDAAKKSKPLKKVKTEVADAKKKPKKDKSPQRVSDPIDAEKKELDEKAQDIKTQQTIEKLLKQANRALKAPRKSKKNSKKIKLEPKLKSAKKAKEEPYTSDDLSLKELSQVGIKTEAESPKGKKIKEVKNEPVSDDNNDSKARKSVKPAPKKIIKTKGVLVKKRVVNTRVKTKIKRPDTSRKMKLLGFWNGPKRHRVASLNALAKVHCLYENETRGNLLDPAELVTKKEPVEEKKSEDEATCTRTLRSVPGLRAIGKHWDMHDTTSSSDENSSSESSEKQPKPKLKIKKEAPPKKVESTITKKVEPKRKRPRSELMMDLKDMVVRKRMASLNASAILAASYSMEKRPNKSPKSDSTPDSSDYFITDNEDEDADKKEFAAAKVKKEEDEKVIEVLATPNKKVAVILNQDTDVTITGVYVNSTTRSTHHEGYCSIAGMQYRISATSHTQTAATAVATETLLQSSSSSTQENSNSESLPSCKSYTPLDALSNMQPPPGPGLQHGAPHMGPPQHVLPLPQHQLSPSRRHGCSSAFSAPHAAPYVHHPGEPGYVHGYYQPAGPLITVPHGHTQQPPITTKSAPLSDTISPTSASPIHHQQASQPPAPSSNCGDSSDSEVIITSVTAGKEPVPPPVQQPPTAAYRYPAYPGAAPPGYSYGYPHYYPSPAPAPSYAHHDLCYSTNPYLHHKYPPTTFRRYIPGTQYYAPNPADMYGTPPPGPPQQTQQVVTATPVSASGSTFQAAPSGPPPAIMEPYPPPPPPTLVETYPHGPHYYPSYGPAPPSCYTHSPATRTLPFINATYQSCPCPMQSCPKNVLTGPLTGDSKRSNLSSIAKDSMPLPPVALALPLEPASATGPPSPARGSAGMPPPPSPAGATYQPAPPKQEDSECNPVEKKRKARVGKAMVRNNIAAIQQNTMLLMCHPTQRPFPGEVKREIESPKDKEPEAKKEICSDDELKTTTTERIPEPQNLKKETCDKEDKIQPEPIELQPCINTVAENVKVKNMKRTLSTTNEPEPEVAPPKKIKLEAKYPNGSYKDLIKRDASTIRMTNGRRKLITEDGTVILCRKRSKARAKKIPKRKLVRKLEESTPNKRLKSTKPLSASNQFNSKCLNSKQKEEAKKRRVKSGPAILDNLIAKNSIDRTIDSVISESSVRTTKEISVKAKSEKSTNRGNKIECRKVVASRRKSKCKEVVPQVVAKVPRRSLQMPRWSNGWIWEGEPYDSKVFLNSDETTVVRKCYPAMRHHEGDIIEVRDCVLLKAGPRKNELPFVAKIAHLWENPEDGEMMMSLLWYYRPEHTEQGRLPADQPDEVFASRHKDSNSVACIDDKCYVLTFHEYCRYRKTLRRLEEGIEPTSPCIPIPEPYPRGHRQPPTPLQVSSDMVFFCRRVYDFRQKRIVKNPS